MSAISADLVELLNSVIEVDKQIAELEGYLNSLKRVRELHATAAVDAMAEAGMQSVRLNGRTLFLARDLYVSVPSESREKLVEYCEEQGGLADLVEVGVNTSRLKSYIREELGDIGSVEDLPEGLRQLVRVHEAYKLRNRKG